MTGTPSSQELADLSDPESYSDRRLVCDLVMKGGITSGVVYPLAVSELATTYRFRNIGGTSAGAISAAAAAAAEHRGDAQGFIELAGLPARLGSELESLFRPQRQCRRVFRVLLLSTKKVSGAGQTARKVGSLLVALLSFFATLGGFAVLLAAALPVTMIAVGLWEVIAEHWPTGVALLGLVGGMGAALVLVARERRRSSRVGAFRAGVLVLVLVAAIVVLTARNGRLGWGVTGWVLVCMVSLVVAVVVAVVREAARVLPANDYGLVGGSSFDTEPGQVAPLTEWLDSLIQGLAGLPPGAPPLTFGDLAGVNDDGEADPDGVNLTILTTCISRGRTYYLPYDFDADDPGDRFWFHPDELRRALPGGVIDYLCNLPREGTWIEEALHPLVPLPRASALPVVTAVRMSLSFPALISAVPLRSVDWTLKRNRDARRKWRDYVKQRETNPNAIRPTDAPVAEPCWFSDGGIISNFPVHLFDALLPSHPTFGINLRDFHPDRVQFDSPAQPEKEKIFRPHSNSGGISESWTRWEGGGVGALSGFVHAILDTIQNWSDNDQTRVPGFRDRTAHVSHGSAEGGINLAMEADVISRLAERGRESAVELKAAFAVAEPPERVVTGWRNHKWVRFRSSMALLSGALQSLASAYERDDPVGVESYRDLVHRTLAEEPSYGATGPQRRALIELVEGAESADGGLRGAAARLAATTSVARGAPGPAPSLRVTPGHRTESEREKT